MNVNWCLMGLAFALGLAITLAYMIRRVRREVPVYSGAAKSAETEAELPPGPHGPGTAKPNADGSGPAGWMVKGNEDSMLYHSEESPSYQQTVAEVWFRDVAAAEAAGFNRWDGGKTQHEKK